MQFLVNALADRRVSMVAAAVGTAALLAGLILIGLNSSEPARASGGAPQSNDQITFCHANAPGEWTEITTSVNVFFQSGHIDHAGDIWPAFSFVDNQGNPVSVPARGDQAILDNDCKALKPTPTVTATKTVTATSTATVTKTVTPQSRRSRRRR